MKDKLNKSINEEVLQEQGMTDCEVLVMKTIWDSEEVLALRGVTSQVNQTYNKEWKPQTVSTFLARLVKKGFLSMERKGRQFYYYPLVTEEDYSKKEIVKCVDFWSDGKLDSLVAAFSEARGLTKDEAERIKKLLDGEPN